jgi:hypothetical protein
MVPGRLQWCQRQKLKSDCGLALTQLFLHLKGSREMPAEDKCVHEKSTADRSTGFLLYHNTFLGRYE